MRISFHVIELSAMENSAAQIRKIKAITKMLGEFVKVVQLRNKDNRTTKNLRL